MLVSFSGKIEVWIVQIPAASACRPAPPGARADPQAAGALPDVHALLDHACVAGPPRHG